MALDREVPDALSLTSDPKPIDKILSDQCCLLIVSLVLYERDIVVVIAFSEEKKQQTATSCCGVFTSSKILGSLYNVWQWKVL